MTDVWQNDVFRAAIAGLGKPALSIAARDGVGLTEVLRPYPCRLLTPNSPSRLAFIACAAAWLAASVVK